MSRTAILKKISIGQINGVRGGFKPMSLFGLRPDPNNPDGPALGDRDRVTVMTVVGIVNSYSEKTSETMGVSYAFKGEFQAINKDGERSIAPVCFLPEPAQSLIKQAVDEGNTAIEIGFVVDAVRSDDSIKGYDFMLKPLQEPKASSALDHLTQRLLGGPSEPEAEPEKPAETEVAAPAKKGHAKK